MAFSLLCPLLATFLFMQSLADTSCTDCFVQSRAAYYPNSEQNGTDTGACGFGSFGATVNGGDVSAASNLYRNGVGCGACYQVRCTNNAYCSGNGVTIVITDQGSGDNTDFILSQRAYGRMALNTGGAASLLALGVVDIEYRRVSCSYPNKNITVKIDESSSNPHFLAFVIWYQQGRRDITAVQLCEVLSASWRIKCLEWSLSTKEIFIHPTTSIKYSKKHFLNFGFWLAFALHSGAHAQKETLLFISSSLGIFLFLLPISHLTRRLYIN